MSLNEIGVKVHEVKFVHLGGYQEEHPTEAEAEATEQEEEGGEDE